MRNFAKQILGVSGKKKVKYLMQAIKSFLVFGDLNRLALIWGTDKWGEHWYTQHYNRHFKDFKNKKFNLLEIGVGGYEKPDKGGNSLRTWKYYFNKASIFAIDIYDKSPHEEKRIKIFEGSQVDKLFLDNVCKQIGDIEIIIDDGSHINEHIIETFIILFPKLKVGGIYVVEDLQTSYWTEYGGDNINLDNPQSAINFFRSLVHCLNYKEFASSNNYKPSYFDENIFQIHFYHNMVFIYKLKNVEKTVGRLII